MEAARHRLLPPIDIEFASELNGVDSEGREVYWPYVRNDDLARPWAIPGTEALMHRIGGIEKQDGTGNISYDPANHEFMVRLREERILKIADKLPPLEVMGDDDADILVVGWGSTWGAITSAVGRLRSGGTNVASVHMRHLYTFAPNLCELMHSLDHVVVPEMKLGQLTKLLRAEFLVDAKTISKVSGQPFTAAELVTKIRRSPDERRSGHQEGLVERPRGSLVPRLRGLLDPHRHAVADART